MDPLIVSAGHADRCVLIFLCCDVLDDCLILFIRVEATTSQRQRGHRQPSEVPKDRRNTKC